MSESAIPVHKLILLHITDQVPGIRRSLLCDAALATLSMDYFDVTQALDELLASRLIHVAVRKGEILHDARDKAVERCDLTEAGQTALKALENQIPPATKRFLSAYLSEGDLDRRLKDTITTRIEPTPSGQYRLTCRQAGDQDGDLTLSLLFPTEDLARKAALAWRERSHEVLTAIIEALLPEQEKTP